MLTWKISAGDTKSGRLEKRGVQMQRKILFVTGKDAHNKGTYKIYEECVRRGFDADVYATTFADNHLLLFQRENIEIQPVEALDEEQLKKYDYIFSAVPLFHIKLFRESDKYIFMNPSTHFHEPYFTGDFNFTARDLLKPPIDGKHWKIEEFNYYNSLPAMAAGLAALEERKHTSAASNVILFVDAGHFPFGSKKELAEYVIEIARHCPDHEIRIKPRYLPSDTSTTHMNKENLFTYLENCRDLPQNIKLIKEHTDLTEEVAKANMVICPEATSSYEEVILAKKRLIIFTGFPNNENLLWPPGSLEVYEHFTYKLANRVHYKEITSYLPEGIETNIDDLHLYKLTDVAADIVDAMEYIYEKFLSHNRYPADKYYKSEDYRQKMETGDYLDLEAVKRKRYQKMLYDSIIFFIDRLHVKADCSSIHHYIEECGNDINEFNFDEKGRRLKDIIYEWLIQNRDSLPNTAYAQSLLCLAYFKRNRFEEFAQSELKCRAYYEYCLAKIDFDQGKYEDCLKRLNLYFDEVENNLYEVSYADDEGVKVMAHYYKGAALFHLNDMENAKIHLQVCDEAWKGKHKMAAEYLRRMKSE